MEISTVKFASLLLCAAVFLRFPECSVSEAKLRPRSRINLNQNGIVAGYNGRNWGMNDGYNWKKRGWGIGVTFGKRNQILAPYSDQNKTPADRLIEITDDLATIKSELSDTALTKLALPRHDQPITNEILLRDIRCLRRQIVQVVAQLKTFVTRAMAKYGPAKLVAVSGCKTLEGEQTTVLTGNDLVQMKKFILALITAEAELLANQQKMVA